MLTVVFGLWNKDCWVFCFFFFPSPGVSVFSLVGHYFPLFFQLKKNYLTREIGALEQLRQLSA